MTTPTEQLLDALRTHGCGPRSSGKGWSARCPAHDDHEPSLSIGEGDDGRALVYCHRGCAVEAVCKALGLTLADLMAAGDTLLARSKPKEYGRMNGKARIVAQYDYGDEAGNVLFQVVRYEPKNFRQRRPDGKGGWTWCVKGVRVVPYRLRELLAEPARPVVVAEGEKDCENLARIGVLATTNAGGAGKWAAEHSEFLRARNVFVIADNDEAGRKHAEQVARSLQGIAQSVRIVELAGLPVKGDVSDWIAAGGTKEELQRLAEAASVWTPATQQPGPIVRCMSDVQPRPINWLWPRRIPLGRITLLVGRPGDGKSMLTLDAAARVTTGRPWPDGSECPRGDVLLLTAEDDPADTIRPRLDAHGADVRRVHLLSGVRLNTDDHHERLITLADVDAIDEALSRLPECRLLVIDPIGSFLGDRTDGHRDNEVRAVLAPIAALAERYAVAVLVVAHTRKSAAAYADDLALGSRAFTGVARVVWHLRCDPQDKTRRLILPGKNNLAEQPDGLAFSIAGEPPCICWEREPVTMTADEAVAAEAESQRRRPGPEAEALDRAMEWLQAALAAGPRSAKELYDEWQHGQSGSKRTLERAKQALPVEAYRPEVPGPWWWRWIKTDKDPLDEQLGDLGGLAKNAGKTAILNGDDTKAAKFAECGGLRPHGPDVEDPGLSKALNWNGATACRRRRQSR